MKIVLSIHEGLVNVPRLYGSEVRDTGTAHDFGSGLRKAGKVTFPITNSLNAKHKIQSNTVLSRISSMGIMTPLLDWLQNQCEVPRKR